ncbi:MAG: PBP1A family penicillin-binding protein [Gemmatimonadetes bacterium]|nr:PBP1A family penicillin-binding protein [Gemmatimonadota bacterium]
MTPRSGRPPRRGARGDPSPARSGTRSTGSGGSTTSRGSRGGRRWRRGAVVGLAALGLLAVLLTVYALSLEREITAKWQGRKWNIPSRIYSDVEPIYPGLNLARSEIPIKLESLGYRRVSATPRPGQYSRSRDRLTIHLHEFDYPDGAFRGFPLELSLAGNRVTAMRDGRSGRDLSLARLEPEMIASIFDEHMEDRTPVALRQVPRDLADAILAVEDKRFFTHRGVDPVRIAGAAFANLKPGEELQGGSTLTQQLVKNYYLTHERTLSRKLKEAQMALVLEAKYRKRDILEAYLNEIYLGQQGSSSIAGVGEAAKYYFSKDVGQLTLGECALLAGLIRNPGFYNPYTHGARAEARRDLVLRLMLEQERITRAEHDAARKEPIEVGGRRPELNTAPYFVDFVLEQLEEQYGQDALTSEGLRIFTTLDMRAQRQAREALVKGLDHLEEGYPSLRKTAGQLEGAFVVIDPQTGYVKALVGGRDYGRSQFNRVTQARRQPGSTFKPFVYLTAFQSKTPEGGRYTTVTGISDDPFTLTSGGRNWTPENYDKQTHGTVTLRTALEKSYNVATARLALQVGLKRVVATARAVGITSPLKALPSLALGAFEVRPLEMAAAFTTLANGGIRAEPLTIVQVVDSEGRTLEKREIKMKRVVDAEATYLVNSLLQGTFERGTAAPARRMGYSQHAAGKTGTTSDYKDTWFVGYTPELLALTWVGFDSNRPVGLTGDRAALPIWTRFMLAYAPGVAPEFNAPEDILLVGIDPASGYLSTPDCPVVRYEPFVIGTEPTEVCPLHGYLAPQEEDGWWIF